MRNKKIGAKAFALFCIVLMSMFTISTALALQIPSAEILPEVSAQSAGTCAVDNSGRYFCNESIPEGSCAIWRAGKTIDEVDECKAGTCVPLEQGGCVEGMSQIKCTYNNTGRWYDAPKSDVADCNTGCCVAPNKAECYQEEKSTCEKKGYNWSDKSASDCAIVCGAVEYGCCEESGIFRNKHREDCTGKFYGNEIYCSQVIGSGVQPCKGKDIRPGNGMSDNDKYNCYCYDSNGDREGIAKQVDHITAEGINNTGSGDCAANEICRDPDGQPLGEPAYCVSTSCVDYASTCTPSKLNNGESLCVNVFPGHFNPGQRSTALKNWIIRCQNGEIMADDSYDSKATREKLCIETIENGNRTTKAIANNWQDCLNCGSGGGVWDAFGYVDLAVGPWMSAVLGNICVDSSIAGRGQECSGMANAEGKSLCYYDNDMWPPLGSCNPVMAPGGDHCGNCGGGGDDSDNVCTEEECEHMGDCQFMPTDKSDATLAAAMPPFMTFVGMMVVGCPIAAAWSANIGLTSCWQSTLGWSWGAVTSGSFYWAIYSIIFSGVAATYAQVKEQKTEIINGKIPLANCIASSKAVEQSQMWDPNWGHFPESTVGTLLTYGVTQNVNEMIGRQFIAKQISPAISSLKVGKTLTQSGVTITRTSKDIFTVTKPGTAPSVIGGGDVATRTSKDFASKVPQETAKSAGSNWIKFANVVGLLASFYFAGRAMNPGDCVAEGAYTPGQRADAGKACEDCGWKEGQPYCTKERCEILGAKEGFGTCMWIQGSSGRADGTCLTKDTGDKTAPQITSIKVEYFDLNNRKMPGVNDGSGTTNIDRTLELPYNMTYIKINVTTNEGAKCSYSTVNGTEQSAMTEFANQQLYPESHQTDYLKISRTILPSTFTYYIKCVDVSGNTQPKDENKYYVKFKVAGGPDKVPPVLEYLDPAGFMPEGTVNSSFRVLAYDNNGVQSCDVNINGTITPMTRVNAGIGTQRCVTTTASKCDSFRTGQLNLACTNFELGNAAALGLTGERLQAFLQQQNEFTGTKVCPVTISCTDSKGNEAEFNNSIIVTSIFNVTIANITDQYDRLPTFNVTTTRTTTCTYELSNKVYTFDDAVYGVKEHVVKHNETLFPRITTPYRIVVTCKDIAGTKRTATKDFTVLLDSKAPDIVRAYAEGSILHLVTNEKAICVYGTKDCTYTFEDGTGMPEGRIEPAMTHEALFNTAITYYVKCKDRWDNKPTGCTSIIKPYEIATI